MHTEYKHHVYNIYTKCIQKSIQGVYKIDTQFLHNYIQNVFTFKIVNKTTHSIDSLHFVLLNQSKGTIYTVDKRATLRIKAEEILDGTVFIELPNEAWSGKPQKLHIGVYNKELLLDKTAVRFTGPRTYQ